MKTIPTDNADNAVDAASELKKGPRLVAVIDIGTTAIRMAIAEIKDTGEVYTLETLSQEVNLGKDVFIKGLELTGKLPPLMNDLKALLERVERLLRSQEP